MPEESLRKVDFPEPFGPISATSSPFLRVKERPLKNSVLLSYEKEMFLIPIVSIGPCMDYLPCLLMRYMKYGAPIMDVIMPEGISVGEMTVFPTASARARNVAPASAERGKQKPCPASGEKPNRMRNEKPDKPYYSAHCDGNGGH